jgi:hypothetical protein
VTEEEQVDYEFSTPQQLMHYLVLNTDLSGVEFINTDNLQAHLSTIENWKGQLTIQTPSLATVN